MNTDYLIGIFIKTILAERSLLRCARGPNLFFKRVKPFFCRIGFFIIARSTQGLDFIFQCLSY
jgi:hypothetical protein